MGTLTVTKIVSLLKVDTEKLTTIDLFTDTAAILNLLDLRSIMGCPGGIRSEFTHALWAKRELQSIFLRKKAIIITSNTAQRSSFSLQSFSRKTERKIGPKSARKY